MPTVKRNARVAHTPEQMFDLVEDVESYPKFLHWCRGARIDLKQGNTVEATLDIGVLGFHQSFRTRNTLKQGDTVTVEGSRARDGSLHANARVMTLASTGKRLFAGSSQGSNP